MIRTGCVIKSVLTCPCWRSDIFWRREVVESRSLCCEFVFWNYSGLLFCLLKISIAGFHVDWSWMGVLQAVLTVLVYFLCVVVTTPFSQTLAVDMDLLSTQSAPLPPFDIHGECSSQGTRWDLWLKRFENFLVAANIEDSKRRRALLLHFAGEQVHSIFTTLEEDSTSLEDGTKGEGTEGHSGLDSYKIAVHLLNSYFQPKKNIDYESYVFRSCKQNPDETLTQFCTRLRKLAATCEFLDVERAIKTQIITATRSTQLRRRALRE